MQRFLGKPGEGLRLQRSVRTSIPLPFCPADNNTLIQQDTAKTSFTTQLQRSCQELKETLAHLISTNCCCPRQLPQLHAQTISLGLIQNSFLASLLISKYCSFGDLIAAHTIFDSQISKPKTLLWNSLIRGYSRNGQPHQVLGVYREMSTVAICQPDNQTFNLVIKACTELLEFKLGFQVHAHACCRGVASDVLVGTALVDIYCKSGDIEAARQLFDEMPVRDVVSWNVMIVGYSRKGLISEVFSLFHCMRFIHGILPTEVTLISLVSVCGDSVSLKNGEFVHAHAIKIGFEGEPSFCNCLMEMYIKCNCLNFAFELFDGMMKDAVSWSTMIGGYAQNGSANDALKLFQRMILGKEIVPTRPILINTLLACADLGDWQYGKWIEEEYISNNSELELDFCLNTTLIYMYTKCGKVETSFELLEKISHKKEDVIAWNAMIKACAELGHVGWVSKILLEMQQRGINLDHVTILTLLPLFSTTASLIIVMEAHAYIVKNGFGSDRAVANSLIDMYAKCGSIEASCEVFNGLQNKDVVSWSSIIKGYARNGNGKEAIALFLRMQESGTRPNHITLTALLSACSHCGFVEKGRELFKAMEEEYGIEPNMEHYSCMVDVLCRAGLLSEAYQLTKSMPMGANAIVLGALLSSCRTHGNWEIGEEVARDLFYLEPRNAANYIILARIYISGGRRKDANSVLRLLREKGLRKSPGWSWVEGKKDLTRLFEEI